MPHRGIQTTGLYPDLKKSTQLILAHMYRVQVSSNPISNKSAKKAERNEQIRFQYKSGLSMAQLAITHSISEQRIHQIIHGKRK